MRDLPSQPDPADDAETSGVWLECPACDGEVGEKSAVATGCAHWQCQCGVAAAGSSSTEEQAPAAPCDAAVAENSLEFPRIGVLSAGKGGESGYVASRVGLALVPFKSMSPVRRQPSKFTPNPR